MAATVYSAPEHIAKPSFSDGLDTYNERCEAYRQQVVEWAKEHGSGAEDIVGEIINFPRGDGYASYVVFKSRPLALIHLDDGDGWHADEVTLRGLRVADVREQRRQREAWTRLGNEQTAKRQAFIDTLAVGDIVHSCEFDPFKGNAQHPPREGKWIRWRYEGGEDFTPVALVGGWHPNECGHRYITGETSYGYHAQKVIDGEAKHGPDPSELVENPKSRKRMGERASDPAYVAALEPIDLTIPEPTAAQQELERIHAALHPVWDEIQRGYRDDPEGTLATLRETLAGL